MDTTAFIAKVTGIGGEDGIAHLTAVPKDWPAPLIEAAPDSVAAVQELVLAAEADGAAIVPVGGRTLWEAGYPPPADRPYFLLSSRRLNRITDYQPDDLTVTCEPGATLAQVQELLAPRRQMLALDAPLSAQATLGGLVSANAGGFWRPAYGSPRDLLIGVHAVMTEGVTVKGGGKVVKNVAGYDVCKLFTGAWGTLGFLTELTFRVRTLPDDERTLHWKMPNLRTAAKIGLELHHAQLAPTFLLATNETDGTPGLVVGLQGTPARLDWQTSEFAHHIAQAGIAAAPEILSPAAVTTLRDKQARLDSDSSTAVRVSVLPSELADALARLENAENFSLTAAVETGLLNIAAPDTALLASLIPPGNHVWIRRNADVPAWSETPATLFLHRALKEKLDPRRTFSPGRFLGKL